jgi:Fe-S oxidoreductase
MAARMSLLLRRMPYQQFLSPQWQENMRRINDCTHCNNCRSKCPYGINTPDLLQKMLADYEKFILGN